MSPALVDFRTPLATPQMQSRRSSLKNPNPKGEISSPFLFDLGGFSSNNISEQQRKFAQTHSEVMNSSNPGPGASTSGNPIEGSFDSSFASPSMSRLGSEKPSVAPPSGRSKPRLVKVRKQLGSQVRSTVVSSGRLDPSFNPFRSDSEGLDQGDNDSGMQDLRDQWRSWNPFSPDSASKSGGSNTFRASSSSDFKFGKSGGSGFVFGGNQSNSVSNSNVDPSGFVKSVGKSIPDGTRKSNIESESEYRNAKDAAFSFNAGGRESSNSGENSDGGVFVFGSINKKSSDFDGNKISKSSNEMGKFDIGASRNEDGASVFEGSIASELQEEMKKLNVEDIGNVDCAEKSKDANLNSEVNYKNSFVFGIGKSTDSSFDRSSVTTLPDEMKKLNMEGSGNGDGVGKINDLKAGHKNIFVFGCSKDSAGSIGKSMESMLPDELRKLNIGSRKGESTGHTNMGSSSRIFVKETQQDPAVVNTIPTQFNFQAGLGVGQVPSFPSNDDNDTNLDGAAVSSSSLSSTGSGLQSVGNAFEMPSTDRAEMKGDFSFMNMRDGSGTPYTDLKTPKQDGVCSSTGSLLAGLNQKLEFSAQRGTVKDSKVKKRKGKLRKPAPVNHWAERDYVSRENSSQEIPESPGCFSPMDFSPYQETLAGDQCSRETSMASDGSFQLDNDRASPSTDAHQMDSTDSTAEGLVAATQSLDINKDEPKCRDLNEEGVGFHFERNFGANCPSDQFVSGAETESSRSNTEKVDHDSDASAAATATESSFSSKIERQESDVRTPFSFASPSEDASETNFAFAASFSTQGHLSARKQRHYRKNRMRSGQDSYSSTLNTNIQMASPSVPFSPLASSFVLADHGQGQKIDSSLSQSKVEIRSEIDKKPDIKKGSVSTAAETTAAQESCEKWRLRGNQAYANGHLSKAEDYYTRGVTCVSPNEMSRSCLRALVLCYSNRAATRISLGRVREALEDCKTATTIDPNFLKVQVRAANCHLALGEIEDAAKYYKKCLQSGTDVCLDRKLVIEASDGLQKAQQVAQHMDRSTELLQQRTSTDAKNALQIISKGLLISPYSEKLVEMKAEALFLLQKYEEVIQLCEQTLDSAEKNFLAKGSDGQLENMDGSEGFTNSHVKLWRWYLISKSYFHSGRLEEALNLLEKQEQAITVGEKYGSKTVGSLISLAATVRELLRHKAAGNEAFQSGRHLEAVEHYTAALSCNVESRPFAAICICNRAAAYQALGQMTDAIADCSLAMALDENYPKAISRRATLHEMIRDYRQAVNDLQRYISLLEKQSEDKINQSGALGRSTSSVNDIRQGRLRLSTMEEEAKKEIPLDMYLILGIEATSTASDIKKAYRKAALRHHPDKAGQLLARNENGDDGLWKEIAEEVHKDADRLFKMIGEAYAVLSDPTKRSHYDLEEEMRNPQKKGNGSSMSRTSADVHSYPFEGSGGRRQWRGVRKSYGNPHPHWSETSRSNRFS